MEDLAAVNGQRKGWWRRLPVWTRVVIIFVLLVGGCHVATGPAFYYSDPIRGKVIDEHTGQPLAGVVVVPIWQYDDGWMGVEPMYAMEVVTNGAGEYLIPGMGPRLRRPLTFLCRNDPEIWFYKPGYSLGRGNNSPMYSHGYKHPCRHYSYKRASYWDGKTLPLPPHASAEAEQVSFKLVNAMSNTNHLEPAAFPYLWRAMVDAYERLPADLRDTGYGDPQRLIDARTKGDRNE